MKLGEGDSSEGSDSAPSEDNLNPAELLKNLPVADKTLQQKIKEKKLLEKKKEPTQHKKQEVKV